MIMRYTKIIHCDFENMCTDVKPQLSGLHLSGCMFRNQLKYLESDTHL